MCFAQAQNVGHPGIACFISGLKLSAITSVPSFGHLI